MDLRVELFVDDLDASIRFYEGALGFRLARREADYDAALQAVVSAGHQVVEPPRDQSWGLRDSVSRTPTATTGGSRTREEPHARVLKADMRWRRRCG
jgi:catechol 2,3-dioxygenase-like lactoylglutathione lyase family enzyme